MTTMNPTVQEWILKKEGYTPIPIRKRFDGHYEWKLFSKWETCNVPLEIIERDIAKYGEAMYKNV